jgi:hypothetical protein
MDQYTTHTTDRVEAEAHRLQSDLTRVYNLTQMAEIFRRALGDGNKCNNELAARFLLKS